MTNFIPGNKNELQTAVDLWCKDKEQALLKYGHISKWDTHLITDMSELFKGIERRVPINIYCEERLNFNDDINNWDVSNVKNMSKMFYCTEFNQSLNKWNVSNVINMEGMFQYCFHFNGDISNWNVSNVENMDRMFETNLKFNQNLNEWNVSKVKSMEDMFGGAEKFNSPLFKWNVSNVKNMNSMFFCASKFNQNLNTWDVSNTTNKNMKSMFRDADSFDHDKNAMWYDDINGVAYSGFA